MSTTPGMAIWGWMTEPEMAWLINEAAKMDSVVEIGSLHGRSAFAMLTACPGPVYCIDPWNDDGGHCYPSFMGNCGHFENLRAIRGLSPEAAESVPGMVDMVFIDGDHSYEACKADIRAWLPKTRKLICGHDYRKNADGTLIPDWYPGVAQAVDEIFGTRWVHVPKDTAIWAVSPLHRWRDSPAWFA